MSYSERVCCGLETKLNAEGYVPYKDFLREHTAQGNPFKNCPCSTINNAIHIHINRMTNGTMKQCKEAIYKTLDEKFPAHQVDSYWLVADGYLDIDFETAELRDEALYLKIYHKGTPLRIESTRFNKMRAKWVTFMNLPTNKDRVWVQEAIVTGLSYYGEIHDIMVGVDKAKCMRPKTIMSS
ncbi:hypothetical protein DSO57_1010019 [Entomophthora muscae]|uniref:Uncharacterized protein n=1 Tax=Entomophthora muscae TaxID=34485 RepID=A0ACC2S8Q7_9FUNG|nr:hypothetical protein DSO57_1010019 [Entomophthora muscae]